MGNKKSKSKSKTKPSGRKGVDSQFTVVSENRKARHRYEVLDSMECGMMLMGSEVYDMGERINFPV
ncbi:MAG: SsrA-binding protein, partial [Planctomycetes bacterium]|nr:SsrA-binding protein [Planctomycetota bacterium]